jgi:hypothetical protein
MRKASSDQVVRTRKEKEEKRLGSSKRQQMRHPDPKNARRSQRNGLSSIGHIFRPGTLNVIHKNLFNCSGILSTSFSSPVPSVTAASPGFNQNCTTTSPRTVTRSSHGPSSAARA